MGSMAVRRTRQVSTKLGRPSKISKSTCKMLVNPRRNPVRNQPYEVMIQHFKLPVGPRQLQRKLREHTKGGRRYKCAFVKKVVSHKNREERTAYGWRHGDKTIDDFWAYKVFTDEAHIDPNSRAVGDILREEGTRYDVENIEERPPRAGSKFHIAAAISWWGKSELQFYNDEEDYEEQPPYPSRPRRRPTTESLEQYEQRVKEWDAGKPHNVEIKVKGNHMTQKYYVDRLLPVYVKYLQDMSAIHPGPWLLQEDGDPSHGIRKIGLAHEFKTRHNIHNHKHPAQSPDLNPIEGIWNILKQRLRYRRFDNDEEVKKALCEEWDKITLEEIRKRISSMPQRCQYLKDTKGMPIKHALW